MTMAVTVVAMVGSDGDGSVDRGGNGGRLW